MTLNENDKIVPKDTVRMFVNGEDQSGVVGKVYKVFEEIDLVLAEFSGQIIKVPLEGNEPYKELEKPTIESEDRISITGKDFAQAVLTVCTPIYVKSHVANVDECKEIDFGIVAASGAVVANMLWKYLNREKG